MKNKGLIAFILALAVVLFIGQNCEKPAPKWDQSAPIKKEVRKQKAKSDSIKPIIDTQYVEVIKYRDRWHRLKDTIYIPAGCDTIYKTITAACDSAIKRDSLLIESLLAKGKIDSGIIQNQDLIIHGDSIAISELRNEIKKQKRRKNLALILAGALGGVAILK